MKGQIKMEIDGNKKNSFATTGIPHQPNLSQPHREFKDLWLQEMLRDRADLGIVAWLKTLGDCGQLERLMTCKELSKLSGNQIHWKTIGRILTDLRIERAAKKSKAGVRFNMEDFRSKVTLTSLPRYLLSDLKSAKPITYEQWGANFDTTYKDSIKRWRLDHPSNEHDLAEQLFQERYGLSFNDHLHRYHVIIDNSSLHPAPKHMHGYCLLYKGGNMDEAGYPYISSFQYKNKNNLEQPELHTPMAHRLVALVHWPELDFGPKWHDRKLDTHHTCKVRHCVNPYHLLPLETEKHSEWHKDISKDLDHPVVTNPIGGDVFPTVSTTTSITASNNMQIEMFSNATVSLAEGRSVLTSIMIPQQRDIHSGISHYTMKALTSVH